ncbi:BLUF domain-containing protein [Comamonas sp. CMM02]|uniref:BLUF domain-containing protein n=1 Tax=Comamonas sp. CMM02 TaxID=2769307 RepID=UPI00178012E6|nr:BLUF domain-containing protein [Comamonas sp. CMM02]MBD9402372.1 BLUF domain-containing protein [Comamonas sp. CMM02]
MHQELQCFMYHSELAPTAELSCVADIVKTARDFNQLHAITGVLIFDGQRFAQYIEGEAQAIDFLIGQLARDPRHINFTPQHNGPRTDKRWFPSWSMAYVLLESTDPLGEMSCLCGASALEKLQELLPELDFG